MRAITIIIPTLDEAKGQDVGKLALLTAGCSAKLIVVAGPKRGFTKTVNDGIRQTDREDICLLNDDVTCFQYGWLAILQRALYSSPEYSIAAPTGKSKTRPMGISPGGLTGIGVVDKVPFWCVLIRRAVLDDVGLLDESLTHYASDVWYCFIARRAGWKLIWVRDVYLHHRAHGSGLIRKWAHKDNQTFNRLVEGL